MPVAGEQGLQGAQRAAQVFMRARWASGAVLMTATNRKTLGHRGRVRPYHPGQTLACLKVALAC